jgi:hypothetical protein
LLRAILSNAAADGKRRRAEASSGGLDARKRL